LSQGGAARYGGLEMTAPPSQGEDGAAPTPTPLTFTKPEPPTSKPIYLGKYDFAAVKR